MTSFIYYVYAYIRQDGTPYYIGKGKGNRYKTNHRSHGISIPKDKSRIIFLETNLSNCGSLALERRYIRWYGRKDNGTGILRNRTDGGDPGSYVPSKETNRKISESLKGRTLSEDHIRNIKEYQSNRTEEHKNNISLAKTGTNLSTDHKNNIGNGIRNSEKYKEANKTRKKWTKDDNPMKDPEFVKRLPQCQKGYKRSERAKEAMRGVRKSEEHKAKMRVPKIRCCRISDRKEMSVNHLNRKKSLF